MVKILLVEDDPFIRDVLVYYFEKTETYSVTCASTAGEALGKARDAFDVILLDILLPDANGIRLCEKLRKWHTCPIIFISCLDTSETIIEALAVGGDDFVTKPFDNDVLIARIEANLRRFANSPFSGASNTIKHRNLVLDADRHVLLKDNREIKLSATEFRLLSFFMSHPNKHYTPRELYKNVWGSSCNGDSRTVLVHIYNLRQKVEDDPANPQIIVMDWGEGYTLR